MEEVAREVVPEEALIEKLKAAGTEKATEAEKEEKKKKKSRGHKDGKAESSHHCKSRKNKDKKDDDEDEEAKKKRKDEKEERKLHRREKRHLREEEKVKQRAASPENDGESTFIREDQEEMAQPMKPPQYEETQLVATDEGEKPEGTPLMWRRKENAPRGSDIDPQQLV
ncbi:protein SREK1IP1-like [Benincasa hispida]|uniref:protein SREK1IP1-like n=1 Tax=Benincasa hispida TaxID=102211 RepID=UPI001902A7ED|nr:protein SREK1IP1-like [Benincasa hispida]